MTDARKYQMNDKQFPNSPADSVSCLDCNGTPQTNSTVVVAGAWDNTVSCYEIQYQNDQMSNIVPQAQLKHDAPVLACAMNTTVRLCPCVLYVYLSPPCDIPIMNPDDRFEPFAL